MAPLADLDTRARPETEEITMARVKVALLSEGLRVSASARDVLAAKAKPALRVRSGSCGGLDLLLPNGFFVNAPVYERFAARSPFELTERDGALVLCDARGRFEDVPIAPVPAPAYYDRVAEGGTPLSRIGQLCSDRLGIGLTNICTFWRSSASRCKFCSIGRNVKDEQGDKSLPQILAAVEAAYTDPVAPAKHLLLGGGTPDGPDAGAVAIARAAAAIKRRWLQPIYAMISPPSDLGYLELLRESGVDEIGINIELFSEDAATRMIPGKHAATGGLAGYLAVLERAVELFGPVNTRSITVVGLEPPETTVEGVAMLAEMGVLPILSPFRPLVGTQLEEHPTLPADELWQLALAAAEAAGRHDMPLGPVCIPCQSNTLTVPGHPSYRFY